MLDDIAELEDGSAIIDAPSEDDVSQNDNPFDSNVAEDLSDHELNEISGRLLELIEKDKDARKKRDKQYEEGIKRTGLGDDAPGGAAFEGASRAVHPVLAEGCVDYAARAIKEIFPANGPVKTKIYGPADAKVLARAKKKASYLNWQLTTQIAEYRSEKEILLTQLPLGGSQYEKYWFDPSLGRIRMEFVPIDKVLLPYSAASFYTTPRLTHLQDVTEDEFEDRIEAGFYRDLDNFGTPVTPEESASEIATDKIEGLTSDDAYNEDGLRRIYEVSCWLELDGESRAPYVVHIDESSEEVLAIYRNWKEDDEKKRQLDWWVEDKFIPWRGAYGIGLPHLIGGLASSLTGALRALLDSAHIATSPGAVKLKGGRTSGANTTIAQTEIKEIDAPPGVDDIRKVMMPLPFNPPSPVLFQLLDWITAQAKGVVATSEERMDQIGDRTPVGTTMAMIEQGSATYSAIHARLHDSQRKALEIICRLNHTYPDEESLKRFELTADDFAENDDISPVSDPNIFSESQRYAQLQEQVKLLQIFPELPWNKQELARRGLMLLKIDGIDAILPPVKDPFTGDPMMENVAASEGTPLKPALAQDHLAHVWTHVGYVVNPIHTLTPMADPSMTAILLHVTEHLHMYYQVTAQAMSELEHQKDPRAGADQIAMRAAKAAQVLNAQLLQDMAPVMQQAVKVAQGKVNKPPIDPAIQATSEAAMAQIKQKADSDAARLDFDKQRAANEASLAQMEENNALQLAQLQEENKKQLAAMQEDTKRQLSLSQEETRKIVATIQQQAEIAKNEASNQQHQMTELLKNRDDNQTNIFIAQMKEALAQQQPQVATAQPENDAMLRQLQTMLNELEKSRTHDALSTMTEGLRSLIEGQQAHQERTMGLAAQLLRGE